MLYINDTPQAQSDSHTQLYADDSRISYQHMDVAEKVNVLNRKLMNMCEWLAYNKVSIHFVEDKTKCILSSKEKSLAELNKIYDKNGLRQFQIAEYLDATLSGKSMAVNAKRCIAISMQSYISYIEPFFDCECVSWHPLLSKKIRKKKQVIQKKCICFYLKCNSRHHIGAKEFKKINWQ